MMVTIELTPGDALDRLAIAAVKSLKFMGEKRDAAEAERLRYAAACETVLEPTTLKRLLADLVSLHIATFELFERMVPRALDGEMSMDDHIAAIRLNRDRVRLKREIDACCGVTASETKSYYNGRE